MPRSLVDLPGRFCSKVLFLMLTMTGNGCDHSSSDFSGISMASLSTTLCQSNVVNRQVCCSIAGELNKLERL